MPTGIYKRTHVLTDKARKNISEAAKIGWTKRTNRSPSLEQREKQSIALKGVSTWMKGRKHTEKTKRQMSESHTGSKNAFYGKTHTDNVKERLRQARKIQIFPNKNTKPERFLQSILTLNGVKYRTHEPIRGHPDIFIEPNICVFVDGTYWHSNERAIKKDAEINEYLLSNNYIVLRIPEEYVYKNMNMVINKMWVWKK